MDKTPKEKMAWRSIWKTKPGQELKFRLKGIPRFWAAVRTERNEPPVAIMPKKNGAGHSLPQNGWASTAAAIQCQSEDTPIV